MLVWSIDPGADTGLAVWNVLRRDFDSIRTTSALQAIFELRDLSAAGRAPALVLFEDARKMRIGGGRTFGQRARLQGVGSVKRDSKLWEEACELLGVPWCASPPIIGATKMKAEPFRQLTGWQGKTSSHARDAAIRAMNLNSAMVGAMIQEWRQRQVARGAKR
jgi:hypothetical protein